MLAVKGNPLPFPVNKSADNNLSELGNKLYLVPERKRHNAVLYSGSCFFLATKMISDCHKKSQSYPSKKYLRK